MASTPDDPLERFARAARLFLEDGHAPAQADDAAIRDLARRMSADREVGEPPDATAGPRRRLGDFELVRQLGRGGAGIVYEARQLSLGGRRVALKVLPFASGLGARRVARFRREAESGARLSHPNLVGVLCVGEADGLHFIAQELVEGGRTLAHWIDEARSRVELEHAPAYYRRVAQLFAEVAEALHVVHAAGIVHRDVKPTNILLTKDGQPKLGDFGLALELDAFTLTDSGQMPGTPAYMSPEQARSDADRVDARSDVFALGATLYEALTFVRVFDGDTLLQVLQKILAHDPADPRTVRARVPRDLATICLKALEKRPVRRYRSALEMAQDLRRFLADEPIRSRSPGPLQLAAKWLRRHPAIAASGAVLLVALAVVTTSLVRVTRSERRLARFADGRLADAYRDEIDRLADPGPETLPLLETWIDKVARLVETLPRHRRDLDVLRKGARQVDSEGAVSYLLADPEEQAQHDLLADLVMRLEALADPSSRHGLAQARVRMSTLRDLPRRSIEAAREHWDDATAEIADERRSPRYRGLRLAPQLGLVPLRRDPSSQLFEFAHLLSGEPPSSGDDGHWRIEAATGVVLVLVPGLQGRVGADRDDPQALEFDPKADAAETPAFPATVEAFFLSKYEMTQAQWLRAAGTNPSRFQRPATRPAVAHLGPVNPVECVTWSECAAALRWLGLELPSETQWELAARAGAAGPWPCSAEPDCLRAFANTSDEALKLVLPSAKAEPWNDGFSLHAPVGSLSPNAFGLHDVLGNVMEWCLEAFATYPLPSPPPRAAARPPIDSAAAHVARGGGYDGTALQYAAFTRRVQVAPDTRSPNLGVRPMRAIDP